MTDDPLAESIHAQADRGRTATSPLEIPPAGWRDVLRRVWHCLEQDNVSIVAAGVAFFGVLAVFPAITAFVSIYGLLMDRKEVELTAQALSGIMPPEAWALLMSQLRSVSASSDQDLGLGATLGLLMALWSGGAGIRALMSALNIAYRETERRGFLAFYAIASLFTIGLVAIGLLALAVIVGLPLILKFAPLGDIGGIVVAVFPWLVLTLLMMFALGALYRYGASRRSPKTRWVSTGAIVATALWLLSSMLFSFYVGHFASYNQTYGSLGAFVILLMWMWLGAYIVLLGASLNAEMEHQTAVDTTRGRPKPLGQRGAYVADHIGDFP